MGSTIPSAHWLTLYDPLDGEPYGKVCTCARGADHDGTGALSDPDSGDVVRLVPDE